MKITFHKIASGVVMLTKINELNLGMKIEYWCTKNIKILSGGYMFFLKKLNKINEIYCFRGEDGQYYKFIDGNTVFNLKEGCDVEKFNEEMNALMTNECEIISFILPEKVWEDLPNFFIEGGSLTAVDFLLS